MDPQIVSLSCNECSNPPDLFKLKDAIWSRVAGPKAVLCVDCTEKKLGRAITAADLDKIPWVFGGAINPTPEHDKGILDGLRNQSGPGTGMYTLGFKFGRRIAKNSTQSEIVEFLRSCEA